MSQTDADGTRRAVLKAVACGAALAAAGCARAGRGGGADAGEGAESEVTPGEDLMQEHGLLERLLLVYDEAAARFEGGRACDPAIVSGAAGIVRSFVEEYHEMQEEKSVFPRFPSSHPEAPLVATLLAQHRRGREVTAEILRVSALPSAAKDLPPLLRAFARMYRPHAAREDTVLFPAFRRLVSPAAYRELGELFEENERRLLGKDGFEAAVAKVRALEGTLGIAELSAFTPA